MHSNDEVKVDQIKCSDPTFSNAEQFRKLFIGGLTPYTTEEKLRKYYEQWGELVDVVVMKDNASGRSRGFGFVTYKHVNMLNEAQNNRPHEIDGKFVEAKRAMPREDSVHPESHMTVKKLFVGGLKRDTKIEELTQYFNDYGTILNCEIVCLKQTGESRGFGFIQFDDYDPVDKIILCKPHFINCTEVDVKKALSKLEIVEVRKKKDRPFINQTFQHYFRYFNQKSCPNFSEDLYKSRNNNNSNCNILYPYMNKYLNAEVLDPSFYTGGYNSRGVFPKSKGLAAFYKPDLGFIPSTLNFTSPQLFNLHYPAIYPFQIPRSLPLTDFLVHDDDWHPSPLAKFNNNHQPKLPTQSLSSPLSSCHSPSSTNSSDDFCVDSLPDSY